MVTLTIDGISVSVEKGASILEAAQKAGVKIPTLCHDKRLIPYGACRLCIVEVTARGRTRTMPACFNPARDGMEIVTQSPKLSESRRKQLELLLRSHPLLCPSCDAAGDCRLQELVHEYKVGDLPFGRQSRVFHTDNDSFFIRHNMNLCIRCGMCTRICDEVQGQNEISFVMRGMNCEVSTDFERPLDCEFCGQCAQICPVGAIRSRWLVGTGRDFELARNDTTCSFCSLGCTLTLGTKDNKIVYVTSPEGSANEGNLCVKGRYGWTYVHSPKRLSKPMIKKDGLLTEVEWDEAIAFVAENLKRIKSAKGSDSLGVLGSARLTNEEAYLLNRFSRTVLETSNIDHSGNSYRPLVDDVMPALGYAAGTNSIREIRNSDVILLLGADLTETHPVAKNEVILATGRHRATAIVVDSKRTKLTDRASIFIHVPPSAESIIANAMLRYIIDNNLYDSDFVNGKTDGIAELTDSLSAFGLQDVVKKLNIDPAQIENAATAYANAKSGCIIVTLGGPVADGELVKAAVNLALVTGKIGKESSGVHFFSEKANSQGAVDMGMMPDFLPGCVPIDEEENRKRFETAWGHSLPTSKGLSTLEMFSAVESGSLSAMYIVGENPMENYPDRRKIEGALSKLDFLVVQDMFLTSTAYVADAVLPVIPFTEKAGSYTSAERRVQLINPIIKRSTEALDDYTIISKLASKMGAALNYSGPESIMQEISNLVEAYKGISYGRLKTQGIQWPCADESDPGRAILYESGFKTGKAKLKPAEPMREILTPDGSMVMVPAALKFHSGAFSIWSPSLMDVCPEGIAEMSLNDFKKVGIKDGDFIKISSDKGDSLRLKVKVSRRAMPGYVIIPMHFPSLKMNTFVGWDSPAVKISVEKA